MKRKIAGLLVTAMALSTLSGCGGESNNNNTNTDTPAESVAADIPVSENLDTDVSVTESKESIAEALVEEKTEEPDNQIKLKARKDKEERSVVITFDSDKIELSEEDSGSSYGADFNLIGDYDSIFEFTCETLSVQELYDETMDGYRGEDWSVTEMRDGTIADYPAKFFEVLNNGEVKDYYFIMEIDNGISIYNGRSNGYDGEAPFEEMLSYVFSDIEIGDGSKYRPALPYTTNNENGIFTIQFDSGEEFAFDYDETVMELNASRSVVYFDFFNEEDADKYYFEGYISTRYASAEDYINAEIAAYHWDGNIPFSQISIHGVDMYIAYNSDYAEGIFYIPVTGEYAIRGKYTSYSETPVSLQNAFAFVAGEEIEMAQTGTSQGSSSSGVDYGYVAPTALGDDLTSLTYSLDGVVYQFPTPAKEFTNNGWKIPDVYTNQYSEIPAGEDVQVALENDNGSVIYNVVIKNYQDYAIALEDGIVLIMLIADDSNVELLLPEGLSLDSSLAEVEAVSDTGVAINGDHHTYAWFNDGSGAHVASYSLLDTGVEYFEFFCY